MLERWWTKAETKNLLLFMLLLETFCPFPSPMQLLPSQWQPKRTLERKSVLMQFCYVFGILKTNALTLFTLWLWRLISSACVCVNIGLGAHTNNEKRKNINNHRAIKRSSCAKLNKKNQNGKFEAIEKERNKKKIAS